MRPVANSSPTHRDLLDSGEFEDDEFSAEGHYNANQSPNPAKPMKESTKKEGTKREDGGYGPAGGGPGMPADIERKAQE